MTRALQKDGSLFAKPDTYRKRFFHVEGKDGSLLSLCDRLHPLAESTAISPEEVPASLRCARRGCREAWPSDVPVEAAPAVDPLAALLDQAEATLRGARG